MKKWIEVAILRRKFTALRGIIENDIDRKRDWKIEYKLCEDNFGNNFMAFVVYENVEL